MNPLEPKVSLDALDPACDDAGYWDRFQMRVMAAVRPGLARRRRDRLTIGGVMLSWSRLVLPVAAAAAVAAAVLLVTDRPASDIRSAPADRLGPIILLSGTPGAGTAPDDEAFAGVEDVIAAPSDGGDPLPSFLHSDADVDRDQVLFAVEGF